jgi:predicted nucleotidyltransferase
MDRAAVIDLLKTYEPPLRENGATSLFIFGSRTRGTNRFDSDVDLFIDYDAAAKVPHMFRLIEIEEAISAKVGVPIRITTRNALHPPMKGSIEREAIRVLSDAEGPDHRHPRSSHRD